MRAGASAAAKFPIYKPIEDKEQARVIAAVKRLAMDKELQS